MKLASVNLLTMATGLVVISLGVCLAVCGVALAFLEGLMSFSGIFAPGPLSPESIAVVGLSLGAGLVLSGGVFALSGKLKGSAGAGLVLSGVLAAVLWFL